MDRRLRYAALVALCLNLAAFLCISSLCVVSHDAAASSEYMRRFNIPTNHIHLEWARSGSGLESTTYKGKTYTWLPGELLPSARSVPLSLVWWRRPQCTADLSRSRRGYTCTEVERPAGMFVGRRSLPAWLLLSELFCCRQQSSWGEDRLCYDVGSIKQRLLHAE